MKRYIKSTAEDLGLTDDEVIELYQNWFKTEIEPDLENAFPGCKFFGNFTEKTWGDFNIVFSKKYNPWYDGNSLYQKILFNTTDKENLQSMLDTGHPDPKYFKDDYVVRLSKKLISKGIDVNRDVVSQARKEAREAKDADIDMNMISDTFYETFGDYLSYNVLDYNSNLLNISNFKISHPNHRTDFKADLTYNGMKTRVWLPFKYDGFGNLEPVDDLEDYEYDMVFEPLTDIIEAFG